MTAPIRHGLTIATCGLLLVTGEVQARTAKGIVKRGLKVTSQRSGRDVAYTMYRPARFAVNRRYPVFYLLHGHGDNENAWLQHGQIKQTLDRMIGKGQLQPLIVIMPMAGNSWYVDDARANGFGPIAQTLTGDLIAEVDRRYPTAACRQGRAIAGLSMGGFGAIQYAFEHPEKYVGAISLSGSLFSKGLDYELKNYGRFMQLFGGVYGTPFDVRRYNQFNVFAKLSKLVAAPHKPAIWLATGDEDFPSILRGTVRLHQALRRRNIASELRVDNAGHSWRYWSKAIVPALKWLSPKLAAKCPASNTISDKPVTQ